MNKSSISEKAKKIHKISEKSNMNTSCISEISNINTQKSIKQFQLLTS